MRQYVDDDEPDPNDPPVPPLPPGPPPDKGGGEPNNNISRKQALFSNRYRNAG